MVQKITWDEFSTSGLLPFVNTFLHIFGIALILEQDHVGNVFNCYPAKVNWRGFNEEIMSEAYKKLSNYMLDNCDSIKHDSDRM